MQFLVYLIVLTVSLSTVLLEVHWLTSPAPQPKPVIQATSGAVPDSKTEGPNAALSPVYPKRSDTPRLVDSASNAQASGATADTPAASAQPSRAQSIASAEPPQQPPAETAGVAARDDDSRHPAPAPMNSPQRAPQEAVAAPSSNHCDVQACAGAYKSFRASDCTYQSFEGPRRVCTKPLVQRTAREPERRKWSRDVVYPRRVDRSTIEPEIDDDRAAFEDDADRIVIRRPFGPRW